MRKVLISITLAIFTCPAWAETDARTVALDVNPGLTKPISLHVRGMSIREVLDKIEADTGVRMRSDRDVAEDKVSILVKEKPAREVLRAIAHCLNLRWQQKEVGSSTFLNLFMDRESVAALNQRNYEDYAAVLGRFDTELRATAQVINSGPIPRDMGFEPSGPGSDRVRHQERLAQVPSRAAMVLQFLKLSEIQKKALFQGEEVSIPSAGIAKEARDRHPTATGYRYWIEPSLDGYVLRGAVQPDFAYDDSIVLATAAFDDSRFDEAIKMANEALAKDRALDVELSAPKPAEKPSPQSGTGVPLVIPEVPKPGEGSAATPTTMSDYLLPVAESAGISVVAQYASEYADSGALTAPMKTSARLAELCRQHKFTIQRDGDFLLVRSALWHRLREREVPEEKIRRWQRAFTGLPAPTFDALVEMASVTWPQVQGTITNSGRWFGVPGLRSQSDAEMPLKLYASLGPGRQQALWEGAEISLSDLPTAQQTLFMQAFEEKQRPSYAGAQDASWPQAAAISLRNHALEDDLLFATSNMRGLGTVDMADLMPDAASRTSGGDTSIEEEERAEEALEQRIRSELPNLAKKAAEIIAGKHPEVSAKEIGIYARYETYFRLRFGTSAKAYVLSYFVKIR